MYWIARFFLLIIGRLPVRALWGVGKVLGTVAWYILPSRRKVAIINAKIIGVKDPVKTAKESFKHTFISYLEIAYMDRIDDKFIKKYVVSEGKNNFDDMVSAGKNFVFVSGHIGAWDLNAHIATSIYGFKTLIVGRQPKSKLINRLLLKGRNNESIKYMTEEGYVEQAQKLAQDGYYTGALLDHSTTMSNSVIAPFFGLRVPTLASAAVICVRKKIALLPNYVIRSEKGYHIICRPPIYPDENLKVKERVVDLVTRMNQEYEWIIRQCPEQWYLLHKRFKKVEEADGKISMRIYRS